MTVDPVAAQAQARPRAAAVLLPQEGEPPRVITWAQLDHRVEAAARLLRARLARGPGDRGPAAPASTPPLVVAALRADLAGIIAIHAIWRAGGVLVPLNPAGSPSGIPTAVSLAMDALGRVGGMLPDLLVTTTSDAAIGSLPGAPRVTTEALLDAGSDGDPEASGGPSTVPAASPAPAALVLTSGTDGLPTAIPFLPAHLEASAEAAARRLSLGPDDRWLAALSPAHIGGLALVHRAATLGSAVVPCTRFQPDEVARWLGQRLFTHASLVPVMLARLLDAWAGRPAPDGLRCLLVGGASAPAPLVERAIGEGFPVALTYGLTQATSQVTTATPAEVRAVVDSGGPLHTGRPLEGVEVEIGAADPEGVGEIRIRGRTVALPNEHDGWLRTGDLGRLDEEGRLVVVGRLSTRIITGGVNVEPAAVEAVLGHHPGIREVIVLGRPDPDWGERVVAVVVPTDAAAPPGPEAVLEFARRSLSSAARPREVVIVSDLPRNENGKVDRSEVRKLLR